LTINTLWREYGEKEKKKHSERTANRRGIPSKEGKSPGGTGNWDWRGKFSYNIPKDMQGGPDKTRLSKEMPLNQSYRAFNLFTEGFSKASSF